MKKSIFIVGMLAMSIIFSQCSRQQNISEEKEQVILSGPYLGQMPPDSIPELFAPGIISTGLYTRDMAIMPDGKEIYFCVSAMGYNLIFYTKQLDEFWTEPKPVSFIEDFESMFYEPCINKDGSKMYFLSNMDFNGEKGIQNIWAVDREGDGWGKAYMPGEPISTENAEFFPSLTEDATMYFTRQLKGEGGSFIYRSRLVDGKYTEPEKLGPEVNIGTNRFNAFIARDESYIIVPANGMEDSYGGVDYYIIYRNDDDSWSEPVNLGENINSPTGAEWSPYVSPDGKYFFFMASRRSEDMVSQDLTLKWFIEKLDEPQNGQSDIYWVDAGFIEKLRPE